MLLDLPDELLGLVLDATEIPMGLRLASKRFSSMSRGKAKVRELQRRALRTFGIKTCHRKENWLKSLMPDPGRDDPGNFLTGPDETWWRLTGSDE